jgi:hypothetical protein
LWVVFKKHQLWFAVSKQGGHSSLLLGLRLLGKQHRVNVWKNTTSGNSYSGQKFAELLIIANSQLDVAGNLQ